MSVSRLDQLCFLCATFIFSVIQVNWSRNICKWGIQTSSY